MSKIKVNRPGHYIDHVPRSPNNKPCAYCWSTVHRGYLTDKLIKKHKCLQKQCPCLQRFLDHGFWKYRDRMKKLRKERRKRLYGNNEIIT